MLARHSIIGHRRSIASLERDPLLVANHHHTQRSSISRRASLAVFDSTHEEGEVSVVELFSDLVVVVALHNLSDKLCERELGLPMYFFKVLLLWCLWHNCIVMTNLANIYTANVLQAWHHVVIFSIMGSIVLLTKADDPLYMLIAFWAGRFVQVAAIVATGYSTRPVWIDHQWHDNLKYLSTFLVPLKAFVESIPLLVTLYALHSDTLVLLGGIVSTAVGCTLQIYAAHQHDVEEKEALGSSKLLDVEHLKERHELIVLIFLGELCFAAASESGAYYLSLCSLLTVFGCFLLYFHARVPEREEPWTRSASSNVLCQQLHLFLIATVPLMSVGYTRLILHSESDEDEERDSDGLAALHCSAGGFLCIMGLIELTAADPTLALKKPRWKRLYRLLLRVTAGIVVACLYWLPGNSDTVAATIVPVTLLSVAVVEIWASQLVNVRRNEVVVLQETGRRRVGMLPDMPAEFPDSLSVDTDLSE